jgi:hypothetical protein
VPSVVTENRDGICWYTRRSGAFDPSEVTEPHRTEGRRADAGSGSAVNLSAFSSSYVGDVGVGDKNVVTAPVVALKTCEIVRTPQAELTAAEAGLPTCVGGDTGLTAKSRSTAWVKELVREAGLFGRVGTQRSLFCAEVDICILEEGATGAVVGTEAEKEPRYVDLSGSPIAGSR